MFQAHDINSNQMFSSLRLGVWLVSGNEQECSVHDSRTSKHGSHEGIVTWAIDKRDVSRQYKRSVTICTVDDIRFFRAE